MPQKNFPPFLSDHISDSIQSLINILQNFNFIMIDLKCQQKYPHGATYDYNRQIQQTLLESIPVCIKSKCSIKKIIRTICNLMKINPFEASLLSWLLAKSKYEVQKLYVNDLEEEQYDQKVLIYTLLNAYYVKTFLNESIGLDIEDSIVSHVKNFSALYKSFNPEKCLKSLSFHDVNRIFEEWTCRQKKKQKIDYNSLVDNILYLSKTYNVTGNDELAIKEERLIPRKRRKVEEDQKIIYQHSNQFTQKQQTYSNQNKQHNLPSQEIQDFLNPSQEGNEDIIDMNPLRRSTRNMFQSFQFNEIIPSQDNLFSSQISGNGIFGSQIQQPPMSARDVGFKIKKTTSYDESN